MLSIKILPSIIVLYWGIDKYKVFESSFDSIPDILIALRAISPKKIIIEKPIIKLFEFNTKPETLSERIELLQGLYHILTWEIQTKHGIKPVVASSTEYRGKFNQLHKYELLEHARALFDPSLSNKVLLSLLDASFMYKYLTNYKNDYK